MIQGIAQSIARRLGDILEARPDQIEVYAYGLELLLLPVFNFFVVFILAYIIGSLPNTLMFLAVFAPFRFFGGGVHMSTSIRCLVISTLLIVGLGTISTLSVSFLLLFILLIITFVFGVYVTAKWVPPGTDKNPITDPKIRTKQKIYMTALIIIWSVACIVIGKLQLHNYLLALILGALSSLLLMTPWGYNLIRSIDRVLDNINRG
ncbi:accessory gene regulator B family protein [Thermosyntropha sp.]|uniref:accessory gene regulator ArgB-like protein n=1 Tax=Thermosyntropha sp. TaxID=2740820 RepID=UPI0025DBEE7E|nr:accessory gene regulator B family protein [Thermosyntropha sp.]MBO8158945.1 accessory gene regulator B family protein [Thermosyntropha sp.]